MKSGQAKTETPVKKEPVKAPQRQVKKDVREEKKPEQFLNNPFYEAFRKKQ